MKNLICYLLLPCLIFMGDISFAAATELSGYEAVIENGKTGLPAYSFSIPSKFFDKNDSLLLPIEITLYKKNGKKETFFYTTKDLHISLPQNIHGEYNITVRVGTYISEDSISL